MTSKRALLRRARRSLAQRALACALVGVIAAPAAAQPAPPPPPPPPPSDAAAGGEAAPGDQEQKKKEALDHFKKGIELAGDNNWDAALAEFLASREIYPTRVALKNAASMLKNLKRYAEALDMYTELLSLFGKDMPPEEKKSMEDAMAQLRSNVGEIDVESSQPDSVIIIDGQQRGQTPLPAPITVNAGTHSVRISHEGFEPYEAQILVAGKQRKLVKATLKALSSVGTLSVTEATGQNIEVVVDGAVVGKTPWSGTVAVGNHVVFLKGADNIGSPPSSAEIKQNQTATLRLEAVKLDAEIRIEPTPSSASVDIDGVTVGNGVWEGRVKSGAHKIEVAARGHVPFRKDVSVASGGTLNVPVVLDRDLSDPMWQAGFVPHLYLQAQLGVAWAPSLGGGADAACSGSAPDGGCSDRSRPFGFLGIGRVGYALTRGLGVEVFFGGMQISEKQTRNIQAELDQVRGTFTSTDYKDTTKVTGGMFGLGASYQFLDTTPLTLRLGVGAARVNVQTTNQGTFTGDPGTGTPVTNGASVPEPDQKAWLPFVAPEVRFGYKLGKRFLVDVGVAAMVFLPPELKRSGVKSANSPASGEGVRSPVMRDPTTRNPLGSLFLPNENALGTFVALVPTVGARFDF